MSGIQRQFFFHNLSDGIRWSKLLIHIRQQQFHIFIWNTGVILSETVNAVSGSEFDDAAIFRLQISR